MLRGGRQPGAEVGLVVLQQKRQLQRSARDVLQHQLLVCGIHLAVASTAHHTSATERVKAELQSTRGAASTRRKSPPAHSSTFWEPKNRTPGDWREAANLGPYRVSGFSVSVRPAAKTACHGTPHCLSADGQSAATVKRLPQSELHGLPGKWVPTATATCSPATARWAGRRAAGGAGSSTGPEGHRRRCRWRWRPAHACPPCRPAATAMRRSLLAPRALSILASPNAPSSVTSFGMTRPRVHV